MANRYLIDATLKRPLCGHTGYTFEVFANTKAEAIRHARREIIDHGHHGHIDGPISYRATEISDN